jgi:aldehyde dehydrogenase (NAD+)
VILVIAYKNFINGEFVPSKSAQTIPNVNPANTDDVIGLVSLSTRQEAQAAIAAAESAFEAWRATPAPVRGRIVAKAGQLMEAAKEELAALLTREEGKTLGESRGELARSINIMEFIAGEARRLKAETLPSELPNNFIYTIRQPLGVVATITPWNFPVAIPVWKIAPALVAGNTVVFKPSELTPGTATRLVELFTEAGLPPGVLNMVLGLGDTVGDELVNNPAVRAISFTGSTAVGMRIYAQAAQRGAKVQCEMGGKNPVVILEDADLGLAVESTVQGAFGSTGQRCTATSRAVVINSIADQFVDRLISWISKLRVGPGDDPETNVGPSVSQAQYEKVLRYIESGKEDGAELVYGGHALKEDRWAKGYFIEPTIFDRVEPNMRIAQEEIFGPVLSVLRVKDFDEAMEVANGVQYGLSSSIFTTDASRIFQFIDRIETGITHINSATVGGEAHVPFGGFKATGIGERELGSRALEFYTELKVVYVDYTGRKRTTNIY